MQVIEVTADTCDQCGPTVRAYVYATHETWAAPLAFCAHHGTQHMDALNRAGATVIDLRHQVEE